MLVPSVDATLMIIVLMFIALYVLFTRRRSWSRALLVRMGILFFRATRTKEIGLVLIVVVPGLGLTGDGDLTGRRFGTTCATSWPGPRSVF